MPAAFELRVERSQVPTPEPIATPAITAASVAANAYVVGPKTSERIRVHAISWTNAANPVAPRTAIANQAGACECALSAALVPLWRPPLGGLSGGAISGERAPFKTASTQPAAAI